MPVILSAISKPSSEAGFIIGVAVGVLVGAVAKLNVCNDLKLSYSPPASSVKPYSVLLAGAVKFGLKDTYISVVLVFPENDVVHHLTLMYSEPNPAPP